MNNLLIVLLLVVGTYNEALAGISTSRSIGASSLVEKNEDALFQQQKHQPSLSEVLAMVLKDPEYLAMSDFDQYMVLMSLYSAVQNVISDRKQMGQETIPETMSGEGDSGFKQAQEMTHSLKANPNKRSMIDRLRWSLKNVDI
jgi:hypothetical protein